MTAFYSPDYQLETGTRPGPRDRLRAGLLNLLGRHAVGQRAVRYQTNEGTPATAARYGNGDDNYIYWNAGLTLGFLEKWSLDLRYWDTDISNA